MFCKGLGFEGGGMGFPYRGFGHWWKAPEEIDDILGVLRWHVGLEVSSEQPPASYW